MFKAIATVLAFVVGAFKPAQNTAIEDDFFPPPEPVWETCMAPNGSAGMCKKPYTPLYGSVSAK